MIEEKYSKFSLTNVTVFINYAQCRLASCVKIPCSLILPEPCSDWQVSFRVNVYRLLFKTSFILYFIC